MPQNSRAFIFDAYGTLFDVHSVVMRGEHGLACNPQALSALSDLWRRKQLEYTWLLALMERFEDFRKITRASLRASIGQLGIQADEAQLERLMDAYLSPFAFPEVKSALEDLGSVPMAILSNGTAEMVGAAVSNSGLTSCFEHVISVDRVGTYKPSPRVYALGPEILNIPAAEMLFVSSNAWDAAGAKAYGYQVCWCNRSGAEPDHMGFVPDFTVTQLDQISRL
jgi:2-haloacid dehalogenase